MKKLFALLMAAMMLLCCVACGGGNDTPNPPTDTTASITIGTGSTSGTYYAYTNAVGMTPPATPTMSFPPAAPLPISMALKTATTIWPSCRTIP